MRVTSEALKHVQSLTERDGRYKIHAYLFVLAGLDQTLKKLKHPPARVTGDETGRHITGRELSWGLRDCALAEFGPSAQMVLAHWGLTTTRDFGNIVYALISVGLMGKSESDSIEDFDDVFDFSEELTRKYRFNIDNIRSEFSLE